VNKPALLLRPNGKKTDSSLFAMEQLGLSYVAAVAREQGLVVEIVDGYLEPDRYDHLLATMNNGDYQVIGYPIYPETVRRVARDVDRIRQRGVLTHVTVGNHLATLSSERILQEFQQFDSAVRGEGEFTFAELIKHLEAGQELASILGLTYRTGTCINSNPPRPNIENLDTLPFPVRDTLPFVLNLGNAPLLYSSRGCNCRCEFCSVHKYFQASPHGMWRGRSPKNVVDEIALLVNEFGITEFAFADEQFMGHGPSGIQRAEGIADELIKRHLHIKWYIETRSSDVRIEVFEKLHEAGLSAVFMGIESGYDPALKSLKKGLKVSQHLRAIDVLKRLHIIASIGFIMFRPETTLEEIDHNLNFLEEVGCAEITALVTKLRVYSGTNLETSLIKEGKVRGTYPRFDWDFEDWRVVDCYNIVMASADILSYSYNEFARVRRMGMLSYDECLELQHVMNAGPISIVRTVVKELRKHNSASEELSKQIRAQFHEACENFIRLLRFTEVIAQRRHTTLGIRLLNPMSLC